jgi:hypothetical protein
MREKENNGSRQHQEDGERMHKILRGKCINMDRPSRGSRNDNLGRKLKGCTRKYIEIFREHKHPSTD